jgi:hypothetical protein
MLRQVYCSFGRVGVSVLEKQTKSLKFIYFYFFFVNLEREVPVVYFTSHQ